MRKFTCFLLGKYNILFLNTQKPKEPTQQEVRSFMYEDLKVYVSIVCILEIYNILCASCACVGVCVCGGEGDYLWSLLHMFDFTFLFPG